MNILFSNNFAEKFALLGEPASQQWLDTGKAGNGQDFWLSIESTFVEEENLYFNTLQFHDDDVFADHDDINPSKVVGHDWKKLHQIWKSINADYKANITKFMTSGTRLDDFYSFCNGKLVTIYLCLQLQNQPNLTTTVKADLPDESCIVLSMPMDEFVIHMSVTSDCKSTTCGTTSTMKKAMSTE